MKNNTLKACPVCGNELVISKLKCPECDMEYSGSFQASPFSKLSDEELNFVMLFLENEGNLSKIQKETNKSYPSIKKLLNDVNLKLGITKEEKENINMDFFKENTCEGIVKVIQAKLQQCNGRSKMSMLRGAPLDIWLTPSGNGIGNSGYPDLVCEWHILDAIVKKANELGGIMYRGDSAAQSGAKIGSKEFPLDTIDAFISLRFYGASVGSTALRRSTYYAAVLAWAGIVENHRSEGKGGYIVVKPEFKNYK